MSFVIYPTLIESGIENMATDWWLMERSVVIKQPCFRHYQWKKPEVSFGYGQDWSKVEKQTGEPVKRLIRRPTGGGIVRHGNDWTYCLALPRSHPTFFMASLDLYEDIHRAISSAFSEQSIKTYLQPCPADNKAVIPGDCFQEPVGKDLMIPELEKKIAGAAMKRTKSAILFQGTVELGLVRDADLNSDKLRNRFIEKVCECFQTSPRESQWPDRLQIEREPYCRQFNDLAWRKNRERN